MPADRTRRQLELHAFGGEQQRVLLDEAGVRLRQDGLEVVDRKRAELDPDRKAPLQLGDEVARLGEVERARSDEEDVVGLDHAVLGRSRWCLRPAAAGRAARPGATRRRLASSERDATLSISSMKTMPFCSAFASAPRLDVVVVDELGRLLVDEDRSAPRRCASCAAFFFACCPGSRTGSRTCSVISSIPAGPMISIVGFASATSISISLSSKSAFAQALANDLPRRVVGRRRRAQAEVTARTGHQDVEDAILGGVFGTGALALHRRARAPASPPCRPGRG